MAPLPGAKTKGGPLLTKEDNRTGCSTCVTSGPHRDPTVARRPSARVRAPGGGCALDAGLTHLRGSGSDPPRYHHSRYPALLGTLVTGGGDSDIFCIAVPTTRTRCGRHERASFASLVFRARLPRARAGAALEVTLVRVTWPGGASRLPQRTGRKEATGADVIKEDAYIAVLSVSK